MRGGFHAVIILAGALISSCGGESGMKYDIVIRGGTVVDGTGSPGVRADVGIRGDRIAAVGVIPEDRGRSALHAEGKVVAPGFVDIHTHADSRILSDRTAHNFIMQGVTTVVGGNCGGSRVDIASFFDELSGGGMTVNFASLVGHNSVRSKVMGNEGRDPTADELERMKSLVDDAMKAGAVGLSTGLKYRPGVYSKTDEVIELAKVAARYGGFYASHLRDEGLALIPAVEEALTIGEGAGIGVQISHHKVVGVDSWGTSEETLRMMDEARSRGVDVTADQYAYPATYTGIAILFPEWALEGGKDEIAKRFADAATRKKIVDGIAWNIMHDRGGNDPRNVVIASCASHPGYEGGSLHDILSDAPGREPTIGEAAAFLADLYEDGGAGAVYHCLDDGDIVRIMQSPYTMHASDANITVRDEGAVHPRNYGNFPRVLARYVRERGVLTLEEAVRKMTSLPAGRIGADGRGTLGEGQYADLVVFDPETVGDTATWTDPHRYPEGIAYVLVNGRIVVDHGELTGEMPGRVFYGPGKEK